MAQITLNSAGVASNGTLKLQSNGTTDAVTIDTSQNMGLGVTPSAWGGTSKALQFSTGAFEARSASFSSNTNAYFNSGWLYVGTGRATLYNQTDGQHVWYNSASGTAGNAITFTQAMTLDASGNLLVGATSSSGNGERAHFNRLNASQNQPVVSWSDAQDNTGFLSIRSASEAGENGAAISADTALFFGRMISGTFTERARIDSSGNLLVGITSSWSPPGGTSAKVFQANGYAVGNSTTSANFTNDRIVFNASQFYVLNGSSTGVILTNGSTSWAAQSDETTKDIIEPITGATEKVTSLRAVIGKYKTDDESVRRSFLIAQDVQAVLPEAVSEDGEGKLQLRYTEVIPLLVAAIKELKAEIDVLKG